MAIVDKYQYLGITSQARACGGLDMKLSKQVVVSCSYEGGGGGVQVCMCDFIACRHFMGMGGQVHSKASYVVEIMAVT